MVVHVRCLAVLHVVEPWFAELESAVTGADYGFVAAESDFAKVAVLFAETDGVELAQGYIVDSRLVSDFEVGLVQYAALLVHSAYEVDSGGAEHFAAVKQFGGPEAVLDSGVADFGVAGCIDIDHQDEKAERLVAELAMIGTTLRQRLAARVSGTVGFVAQVLTWCT